MLLFNGHFGNLCGLIFLGATYASRANEAEEKQGRKGKHTGVPMLLDAADHDQGDHHIN